MNTWVRIARARRYLKKRMEKKSDSYIPQHDVGTLVRVNVFGVIGVVAPGGKYSGGVPHDPDLMEYKVKVAPRLGSTLEYTCYGESSIRPVNWREYRWYRNPETTRMNMGRTPAFMAITIHVFGAILIVLGFAARNRYFDQVLQKWVVEMDKWWWSMPVIGALAITAVWVGTIMNFKLKWR